MSGIQIPGPPWDDPEYLFNHPDPFGMIAASDWEDADGDGDGDGDVVANPTFGIDPLHTVRHERRLRISEFVDLENVTLVGHLKLALQPNRGCNRCYRELKNFMPWGPHPGII